MSSLKVFVHPERDRLVYIDPSCISFIRMDTDAVDCFNAPQGIAEPHLRVVIGGAILEYGDSEAVWMRWMLDHAMPGTLAPFVNYAATYGLRSSALLTGSGSQEEFLRVASLLDVHPAEGTKDSPFYRGDQLREVECIFIDRWWLRQMKHVEPLTKSKD